MKQNSRLLREYNDSLARAYESATRNKKFAWCAPRFIERYLQRVLRTKSRILDLGIGTGQSVEFLVLVSSEIFGIDISKEMLVRAKAKMRQARLYRADLEKNPPRFQLQSFDAIVASGVLEFIANPDAIFSYASKLLKTDGYFCFTFEEYLRKSKFQNVKISKLGEGFKYPVPKELSFLVYRRTIAEMKVLLKANSFRLLKQESFIAYYKAGRIPVHYRVVLAQKKSINQIGE